MSPRARPRQPRPGGEPFANDSERVFASLLDFYAVRYVYEPVEFVLEWHRDGRPKAGFRPDFYLPDHGCFVEITTLDQRLVTRKHAKLRRLALLYPDVEVKLLHRRDYRALVARHGLVVHDLVRAGVSAPAA